MTKITLKHPELIEIIQHQFDNIGIIKEKKNRLIIFLICLSAKLLKEPMGVILLGSSSAGKSWLIGWISINFPNGMETTWKTDPTGKKYMHTDFKKGFGYIKVNQVTEAALYRIALSNPAFFYNKIIIMEELPAKPSDEQIRVQQVFRMLISEGEVTKVLTIDGRPVAMTIRGHPAFVCCDATLKVDDQLMNRCFLLNPDESIEQNRGIVTEQGRLAIYPWEAEKVMNKNKLLSRIHNHLKHYQTVNRWGVKVAEFMLSRSDSQQLRRTNKLVLKMIEVYALLFQKQRQIVWRKQFPDRKYLEVTRDDVIETMMLLSEVIPQTLTRVLETALEYLGDIKDKNNLEFWDTSEEEHGHDTTWIPRGFTYGEFATFKNSHYNTVRSHLRSLVDIGALTLNTSKKPYKLELNLDMKTPEDLRTFTADILEDAFPKKKNL